MPVVLLPPHPRRQHRHWPMPPPPATTFPDHAHHRHHAQPSLLLPSPSSFSLSCSPPSERRRPCMSLGPSRRPPSDGSHQITLPFLLPPCSVSGSTAGSALPPTSPRPPSLIVVNVVRPGFPARGLPKAATFPRLTGSASPVLGSAATGEALSPPASHPPAEITSPAPFSTRVEPSRTFSELSPRREFHPATVDGVSRTTVYSGHPPLLAVTAEDQHPPRSPAVWPPAAGVIAGRQPPFLACRCIPPRQA